MSERLLSWRMTAAGEPLQLHSDPLPRPGPGEVLLAVRACGLCHTDRGFLYGGVRPNAPLPLTLGHEIVGDVVDSGPCVRHLIGRTMIVPAVLPCGSCDLCTRGRGNVCRRQQMPGNDLHGGFASHFLAPVKHLCLVPKGVPDVENLCVVADAASTAYQSVLRTGAKERDVAIVVGAGGVGGFAAQIARARKAHVVAIDVDAQRLESASAFADLVIDAKAGAKEVRQAVRKFEEARAVPPWGRKILECSGTAAGQDLAFQLLNHDASLAVVGFTLDKVTVRLSNLMAFDATAFGNWGCLPEHYPGILDLVLSGAVDVKSQVERVPMSRVNELLATEHHARRPVLIPDFEA